MLCSLNWTNFRAAARAERRLKPQTTCRRFHPICVSQGTASPQATTHRIQPLLEERLIQRRGLVWWPCARPVLLVDPRKPFAAKDVAGKLNVAAAPGSAPKLPGIGEFSVYA